MAAVLTCARVSLGFPAARARMPDVLGYAEETEGCWSLLSGWLLEALEGPATEIRVVVALVQAELVN